MGPYLSPTLSTPGTGVGRPWFIHPACLSQHPFSHSLSNQTRSIKEQGLAAELRETNSPEGRRGLERRGWLGMQASAQAGCWLWLISEDIQRVGEFSALQYEGAGQQGAALLIPARHPALSPKPASSTSHLFRSQGIGGRPVLESPESLSPQQTQAKQTRETSASFLLQSTQTAAVHSWTACVCTLQAGLPTKAS